jgi:hypothetical protein
LHNGLGSVSASGSCSDGVCGCRGGHGTRDDFSLVCRNRHGQCWRSAATAAASVDGVCGAVVTLRRAGSHLAVTVGGDGRRQPSSLLQHWRPKFLA